MIRPLRPARARIAPAVRPPRPAPTTTTSYCAIQTQSPEKPPISAVLAPRAGHVKCAGRVAPGRHRAVLRRLLLDRGFHALGCEGYGTQPHPGRVEHRIRE